LLLRDDASNGEGPRRYLDTRQMYLDLPGDLREIDSEHAP
jgi:hypothetical protein